MFGTTFGHGTLRKYVIYFGTLFNNIWIKRFDNSNTLVQTFKVPLNYGPREKYLTRAEGNPELNRPIAIQLPRMSFEMTGLYYDPTRKMSSLNRLTVPSASPTSLDYQYAPVPYNIEFTLSIMTKNAEDGTYIVEQILPYFTPEWTGTLNLNPEMGLKYDIPVAIDNITSEDTYEGDFIQRRAIIWTLTFTLKGWLFGPTKSGGKIINEIDVNINIPSYGFTMSTANSTNTDSTVNINITPGVNAVSNSAVSYYGDVNNTPGGLKAANSVSANSDYGFIIDFTENL
jgi:hypothetical protein